MMSIVRSGFAALLYVALATLALVSCSRGNSASAPSACGADVFAHVYHPQRLKVLDACRTITGTVDFVRHERDGDDHVRLRVDDASLLNDGNIENQHGDLVLEPVCISTVTQEDAKDACAGYRSDVAVPPVGTRVSVTGPWVLDTEHGWNEIHPVVKIEATP